MRILTLLLTTALLAACAAQQSAEARQRVRATEEARLAEALKGMTEGKPRSCIDIRDARGPQSYGETTLLFRDSSRLLYRTETRGSCKRVGEMGRVLVTRPSGGSQLCRGDFAEVQEFPGGFFAGTCVMGDFVPYRRN